MHSNSEISHTDIQTERIAVCFN